MAKKKSAGASPAQTTETNNETIEFKDSGIHGMGGFARRRIRKGTAIIEYVGEKISKEEAAARVEADNRFVFTLTDKVDVDGSVDWNPARYLNHSCEPNAEAEIRRGRIWIVAIRTIEPGEEVTYNYSYDFECHQDHPCLCGAENCVGYMVAEEHFPQVRNRKIAA